ncbi:MAG TPA: aldehyde ferredoxin oxidoreductase N-terminal domain-containing protein [Terriglobales bacterium]|nr:aldehyde ferredoxin oxidoreductase N-terminal domain-containing protein [Terriglobales bacterium]
MEPSELRDMKAAHRVLALLDYPPVQVERGYANRTLHVDLSTNRIEIRPVTPYMKEIFTGGKGFDLYLMWQSIRGPIAWDDPANGLYFSAGPLGGTPYFSGSGKCLVTGISPTTGSVMDCNVGGHFGPLLKFSGFDALEVRGKAEEFVLLAIDGDEHRVTIETAPREPLNSYDLASSLHAMYARTPEELQSISVVSAGEGALHTLIGCLNVSFYDWKRGEPRLKQAGRGGLGTVMMHKNLKAIVARTVHNRPRWVLSVQAP